ncbi:hypothetical protein [Streptomyces sp. NPDC093109]|uniref:hypothetical protein n=1 Tax=Streptomyces sp. NPDC093109 TaxID=3154977 RepID=UPI00344C8ECB
MESDTCRITADRGGLTVEHSRTSPPWVVHLKIDWSDLERLEFWTDARDPTVALFAYPVSGGRRFLVDAARLPEREWRVLAYGIALKSRGKVDLDLSQRDARWIDPEY